MVSSAIGSRPFCVILTARRFVFICGETAVMVPWRIVPVILSKNSENQLFRVCTILQFNRDRFIRAFHEESTKTTESASSYGHCLEI